MHINELFAGQVASLRDYVSEGLITERLHPDPSVPLNILNYTPKCQYVQAWDLVTRKCRGLIYNRDTGEVVARPFEKFFNWNEQGVVIPDTIGWVEDKLDGSLGILYATGYSYCIATRGSFESEQARKGTSMLREIILSDNWTPIGGYTYLFEIIYPENRIVLDYGKRESLSLLAVLETETQYALGDFWWPGELVEVLKDGVTFDEALRSPELFNRPNREGFVWTAYGSHQVKVKVKQDDYVAKHKIVFGLNARSIWEILSVNRDVHTFIGDLPDDFQDWAKGCTAELLSQFTTQKSGAYAQFAYLEGQLGKEYTRKDFAHLVSQQVSVPPGWLFSILDGKNIDLEVWKSIYPSHTWRPGGV